MSRRPDAQKGPVYVPVTPGGTPCMWLASPTEAEAWRNLLIDAAHMPYKTKEDLIRRGYAVECWPAEPP